MVLVPLGKFDPAVGPSRRVESGEDRLSVRHITGKLGRQQRRRQHLHRTTLGFKKPLSPRQRSTSVMVLGRQPAGSICPVFVALFGEGGAIAANLGDRAHVGQELFFDEGKSLVVPPSFRSDILPLRDANRIATEATDVPFTIQSLIVIRECQQERRLTDAASEEGATRVDVIDDMAFDVLCEPLF